MSSEVLDPRRAGSPGDCRVTSAWCDTIAEKPASHEYAHPSGFLRDIRLAILNGAEDLGLLGGGVLVAGKKVLASVEALLAEDLFDASAW